MALIHSILGKMNGKLGNVVLSSTGGTVVAREYNPNVSNPNTEKQVDQRAKMKLMSQIAAALAPIIVIPKEGLKSSRNLFIKKNFDATTAQSGVAQVTYENLQITNGNAGLPAVLINRSQSAGVRVNLESRADGSVSRVVYALYAKTSESTLQYVQSIVVEAAGSDGTFPGSMFYTAGDIVVFAYGMIDRNGKATAKYSDYNVQNGLDIARLTMARSLSASDYAFTMTRGTTLFSGETESVKVPEGSARVFVTAVGPGTVTGAGVFEIGSTVTVKATPDAGKYFIGWYVNGNNTNLSEVEEFSFELTQQTDLVARFSDTEEDPNYYVTVKSSDESLGTVQPLGQNTLDAGDDILLEATTIGTATFKGWYLNQANGTLLSTKNSYRYTPSGTCTIWGVFEEPGGSGDQG